MESRENNQGERIRSLEVEIEHLKDKMKDQEETLKDYISMKNRIIGAKTAGWLIAGTIGFFISKLLNIPNILTGVFK